ncbi:Arf GTPase activating protein, partial [Jaminaea rosea]
RIDHLSRLPTNSTCFDCHTPSPRWASIALQGQPTCIFLCIACSGMHRSLGVAVSRVKSVDLDAWSEEQVTVAEMCGGN